jgi:hypothetical protein
MKAEILVISFTLYQILIYVFMRRWTKSRQNRVRKLVENWSSRATVHQHPDVLTHAEWRKKGVIALAAIMIGIMFATILDIGSSVENLSWSSMPVGIAIILAFGWAPWALVMEAYGVVMVMDDCMITRLSPWSKELTINWTDIESVTYSWFWAWFTIRTADGSIHVTTVIVGLEKVAEAIVASVPDKRIHVSREIMSKALRGPFRY